MNTWPPLNTVSLADQDVAFMAYQEALVFGFGGHLFNALVVLALGMPRLGDVEPTHVFVPNVNNRPKRVSYTEWPNLLKRAGEVYTEACLLYEQEEQKVLDRAVAFSRASPPSAFDNDD